MKRNQTIALLAIIVTIIIASLALTINREKPITIIHQTWIGDGLIHLAKEKGYFGNLNINIQRVEGAAERRALLAAGKADISLETIDMSIVDVGIGTPEVMILMLDESIGADGIIATKEIQDIEDLKGKKIGCSIGDPPYFLLRILMQRHNISKDDVSILDIQAEEAGAAFVIGNIDAACTWEPWLSKANARKGGHILVSSADTPGTIVDVMVVRPKILKKRRSEVKIIIKAWLDAYEYYKSNPKESNKIMGKAFDLTAEEFEEYTQGIKWNDLDENQKFFDKKIFNLTDQINEIAYRDGMIPKKIDINGMIDTSLIQEIGG